MTTYLVTGGAGFIGSHLCDALIARGDEVRVLDDLSAGSRANLPREANLLIGDVADPGTVAAALEGVDGCFHLAAIASVQRGVTDWLSTHRVNLTGTITLFDAIRRTGSRTPVVYASSAAVYGDCRTVPIGEDAECRPLSAYGADKYACELHARVASHVHGIPTVGLRFFNVYGPRQDSTSPYSGVISIFTRRLRNGAPLEIFGDGTQTRDFIYVADVVAALLGAMSLTPRNAPVFNVCTGIPTTILDLAGVIAELAGCRPDLIHHPSRSGDISKSTGQPDRLRAVLGLPAPVTLRVGLAHVLGWQPNGR